MATERDVNRANQILQGFRNRIGSQHARIHQESMVNNLQRQRALDGLCGHCTALEIAFYGMGRGEGIHLICTKGNDPVELYSNTPLGAESYCPDYVKKE